MVLALIFIARRIQPFLSLVDRKVEFCLPMNKSFSPCWESFCFVRKNPNWCDCKSGDRTYVQFFGFATNTLNVKQNIMGKRHNRVHPGHFATREGENFLSSWNQLRSFQLDKKFYPVVSQNDLGAPCCVVSPNIISTHPSMTVIFFSSTPIRFQTQCNKL